MNDALETLLRAIVELGDRLHTVMSHADAARAATPPDPNAPPPGAVLLSLLLDVAGPQLVDATETELRAAARLLDRVRAGIETDLFLVPLNLPPGTSPN